MRETDYAFAVAKIRENENRLLKKNTMESLITAADADEAMKILADARFADFSSDSENTIFSKKASQAFELVSSVAPDVHLFDFIVVKNDFHNIKAILKSTVLDIDYNRYIITPYIIEPHLIKSAIDNKDYSVIPEFARYAVKDGYELLTTSMDGQLLDVFLDRLSLEVSIEMAKKSGEEFSVLLSETIAAVSDFNLAYRAGRTGKDISFINNALAKNKFFDNDRLAKCAVSGKKELIEFISETGFKDLAKALKTSDIAFERESDDILIDFVSRAKYQCFSIAPLIAFYLASVSEIKTVRIILSCKRSNMDPDKIRERVRKLYV